MGGLWGCLSAVRLAEETRAGHVAALRRLRDPLLLLVAPIAFVVLVAFVGYRASWPVGFDFRGTLWEPARALVEGASIYPEPTREAVMVGNPAVYPPVPILLATPMALLPVAVAAWLWLLVLAGLVLAAMRVVGVRDWRCYVLAVCSPVVVHGLYYGNLTLALLPCIALAWRYRERARIAGFWLGVAIAAKLFVWPLVLWLLLTRRLRAAAWSVACASWLVFGAWALIGFDGLRDYPMLVTVLEDVYALRSVSVATAAGALGASEFLAVALAAFAGVASVGVAAWLVRGPNGDARAFAVIVAGCVLASPVVWPNYAALVLVPLAITWPRLAPAWFFGYAVWIIAAVSPKPVAEDVCCRPDGVPVQAWAHSHAQANVWFAAGITVVLIAVTLAVVLAARRTEPLSKHGAWATS